MRVLVVNPPFLERYSRSQRSPAVTKSGTLYYPIWLAYATGLLEDHGFEVSLLDAPASRLGARDVVGHAAATHPKLIVLDSTTPSIDSDLAPFCLTRFHTRQDRPFLKRDTQLFVHRQKLGIDLI